VVPGVQVDLSQIKGSTKFDDLTKEGQEFITKVDAVIEQIGKWSNEIKSYTPVHEQELLQLSHDTGYLKQKYALVQRAVLQEDVQAIQELRTMSNQNIDDAQLAMRALDNLKLPAHYHLPGLWAQSGSNTSFSGDPSEADLIGFFNRTSTHLQERDQKLRAYLAEIQQHMPNVEGGLYQKLTMLQRATGGGNEAFEQIRGTLEDMRAAIVSQAVQVGQTRESLTKLQIGFFGQGGTT
jgi:nucleoporin p58/p45